MATALSGFGGSTALPEPRASRSGPVWPSFVLLAALLLASDGCRRTEETAANAPAPTAPATPRPIALAEAEILAADPPAGTRTPSPRFTADSETTQPAIDELATPLNPMSAESAKADALFRVDPALRPVADFVHLVAAHSLRAALESDHLSSFYLAKIPRADEPLWVVKLSVDGGDYDCRSGSWREKRREDHIAVYDALTGELLLSYRSPSKVNELPTLSAPRRATGLPARAQVATPRSWATSTTAATDLRASDPLAGLRPSLEASAQYDSVLDSYPLQSGSSWTYRVSGYYDTSGRPHGWGWEAQVVTETVRAVREGRGFLLSELERSANDVPRLGEPWRPAPAGATPTETRDPSYLVIYENGITNASDLNATNDGEPGNGSPWILQLPLEVGRYWPQDSPVHAWHVEERVPVETPAGRFDGCYRLEWQGGSVLRSRWLCPGVGFVREAACSIFGRWLKELVAFSAPEQE